MTEELIPLGVRLASRRGGSIGINVPAEIAEIMNLKPGDSVAFFYDPKKKRIVLEKISEFVTPSGLSFSISKELAKKLLGEESHPKK